MATLPQQHFDTNRPQLPSAEGGPGLALGMAQPQVPWTLHAHDLTRGVLVLGGQGSGKSSLLYRMLMHRALSANTALVVFDMKGSLVERLLRSLPDNIPKRFYDHDAGQWREGEKRVWYLDLADAAFGLTPLEVREGWTMDGLADTFVHIAGLIVNALKDLFPDQVFQSSQDIITRTVIGTMAIAWWEHVEHHRHAGTRPEDFGFSGSFETLSRMLAPSDDAAIAIGRDRNVPPNPWHVAAGRACQRIKDLDETAYQLLVAIPAAVNANLSNMTQRFQAPANKITPLVAQYPAVRRFVEQRQRLSLQSIVEAHDILIVNPRIEVLGEEAPEIVTTFLMHMLNAQLNRHLRFPADTRPRLTLGLDEAHRLITPTLVRMLATHREAGLSFMAATQYFAQIAATLESPAMRELVRGGMLNLVQTVAIGRVADPTEAEALARHFRPVFDSLIRSGPDDQARIPVDASNISTLPDFLFLVRAITAALDGAGTQALPVFRSWTLPMKEVHEIPNTFRRRHVRRMEAIFGAPEDHDIPAFVRTPPAGLTGHTTVPETAYVDDEDDAAEVARASVGRTPDRRPSRPRSGERDEWRDAAQTDTPRGPADEPQEPLSEDIGGARVHRRPVQPSPELATLIPVLQIALRPTNDPVPDEDVGPPWPLVQEATRRAAKIEALHGVGPWTSEGDRQNEDTEARVQAAREAALVRAERDGLSEAAAKRLASASAARAKSAAEEKYVGQPWQQLVSKLSVSPQRLQILRVLAQLPYSHHELLRPLLPEGRADRTVSKALHDLLKAGLVAHANVLIDGAGGKPILLWTASKRGRELLRIEHAKTGDRTPSYLGADKKLPGAGKELRGRDVAHELSVQVLAGALRQYGGTDVKCAWMTPAMPGGRLDIKMVRKGAQSVETRDLVPPKHPGMAVLGDSRAADGEITPDLSVRLDGRVAGEQRSISILIEVDRTERRAYNERKLIAYDHLLGGWYVHLKRRFGSPPVRPLVLFIAPNEAFARSLARRADTVLGVGLGLSGQDPATYMYYGRTHIAFTCLAWMLAGTPYALRVPPTPPHVRGHDMTSELELVELLPRVWWPHRPTSAPRAPRSQ